MAVKETERRCKEKTEEEQGGGGGERGGGERGEGERDTCTCIQVIKGQYTGTCTYM